MSDAAMLVQPGHITFEQLREVYSHPVSMELNADVRGAIHASSTVVSKFLDSGETMYGVNTGFGLLANTRIAGNQLEELQTNLVLSHSTGVGPDIESRITRLILFLKLNSLARGHSGITLAAFDALLEFLNHDILPCIPSKGSVGASGDLAPLAHMTAALMGIGDVWYRGDRRPANQVMEERSLKPLRLGLKDGLAFINGTQVSTALGFAALFEIENLLAAAIVAGAMSVDAFKGADTPFDPRIQRLRAHPGQLLVAEQYWNLLKGSDIRASHVHCDRVQDPYSLRCQPQVMGACLDLFRSAAHTLLIEANAVTDNPLVFPDSGAVLSGGNFHGQPVAFAGDILALGIAEIGSLSERRLALLVDPRLSGLPAFLVAGSGLNSGFMNAQVTAAALASENKSLAHPASVDSIPTSGNQEDHVSMSTFATRRLLDMLENATSIVAIELLAAAQAIEFHAPHVTSAKLQEALSRIREDVSHYDRDRFLAPEIEAAKRIIESGYFKDLVKPVLHYLESD